MNVLRELVPVLLQSLQLLLHQLLHARVLFTSGSTHPSAWRATQPADSDGRLSFAAAVCISSSDTVLDDGSELLLLGHESVTSAIAQRQELLPGWSPTS